MTLVTAFFIPSWDQKRLGRKLESHRWRLPSCSLHFVLTRLFKEGGGDWGRTRVTLWTSALLPSFFPGLWAWTLAKSGNSAQSGLPPIVGQCETGAYIFTWLNSSWCGHTCSSESNRLWLCLCYQGRDGWLGWKQRSPQSPSYCLALCRSSPTPALSCVSLSFTLEANSVG